MSKQKKNLVHTTSIRGKHILLLRVPTTRHVRFPGFSKASKPRNQKRDFPGIPGIFETIFRSTITLLFPETQSKNHSRMPSIFMGMGLAKKVPGLHEPL